MKITIMSGSPAELAEYKSLSREVEDIISGEEDRQRFGLHARVPTRIRRSEETSSIDLPPMRITRRVVASGKPKRRRRTLTMGTRRAIANAKKAGMTIREIKQKFHVSDSTVSRYGNGAVAHA